MRLRAGGARAERGHTLMEVIISMALGSIVLVGLSNLMLPLVKSQIAAMRGQTAQLALVSAQSAVERSLRQASYVRAPSAPGLPSDKLEGCENAFVEAGKDPAAIDPARPMRWFAYCTQDNMMYAHAGDGCPPQYACGLAPYATFGGGSLTSGATAQFTRASGLTTVVEVDLAFASADASASAQSAVTYAGAAGSNQ